LNNGFINGYCLRFFTFGVNIFCPRQLLFYGNGHGNIVAKGPAKKETLLPALSDQLKSYGACPVGGPKGLPRWIRFNIIISHGVYAELIQ